MIQYKSNDGWKSAIVWNEDWTVIVKVGASHVEIKKVIRGKLPLDQRKMEMLIAEAIWY